VHVIGVPLTELCNNAYSEPRQRPQIKNIVDGGALSVLVGM
jgi:2-oxoglutarate ferredoxin oxidoreductase subunit alpha